MSLSRIARHAQISASHLKYYFPDIETLIEAMMSELLEHYKSVIEDNALKYIEKETADRVFDRLINSYIEIIKKGETAVIFAEDVAFAERNAAARQYLEHWVEWFTDNVSMLIREINPDIDHNKSYRIAAIVVVLLDNMQRFLGEGKPRKSKFRGLEKEVKSLIKDLVYPDKLKKK